MEHSRHDTAKPLPPRGHQQQPALDHPAPQAGLAKQSVLLACSDPSLIGTLEEVVRMRTEEVCPTGLELDRVFDGESCLSRLEERAPDLLVIHARLDRLSGVEVVRRYRAKHPQSAMAVVFLSSLDCKDVPDDVDCDAILSLPFNNATLVDESARALLLKDMR